MNKMNWKWTLVCAAAVIGATVLLDAVAYAGKPAPPTPPAPPIHYRIHYFTAPQVSGSFNGIFAMNERGVMVGDWYMPGTAGSWAGFIYDPLIDPDHAVDLNDLIQVPDGWHVYRGISINDRGAILVNVVKTLHPSSTDPDYEMRGLLIDTRGKPFPTSLETRWTAIWIPVVPTPWNPDIPPMVCYGRNINNNGDLLGMYSDGTQHGAFIYNTGLYSDSGVASEPEVLPFTTFVNNSAGARLNDPSAGGKLQVVGRLGDANGTVFRYTVGDKYLETFPEMLYPGVGNINGQGEFCGRVKFPRINPLLPFRYNPDRNVPSSPEVLGNKTDQPNGIASDINDSRDVVIQSWGAFLYHNEKGMLNLDNLVVGSTSDVAYWLTSLWGPGSCCLTERCYVNVPDNTKYPCIGTIIDELGCFLVPEK